MADNKKSVLLYCDIIHTVKELSNEEAGILFKHYLEYINDLNPTPPDKLTQIVFEPIKQNLKRDLKKWQTKSERNKEIALAGWKKRMDANAYKGMRMDTKNAVNDNVNDNVNVNVNEIFKKNLVETFFSDFPNSTELEAISRDLKLDKQNLITKLANFRKSAELSYPNFQAFATHFKRWVNKSLKETPLNQNTTFNFQMGKRL